MVRAKISTKDFMDLLDEQETQSTPGLSSFREQIVNKTNGTKPNEPLINTEQSWNKVGTNSEQTQNKVGTKDAVEPLFPLETQNKVRTQLRTEPRTNLEQTQNKVGTKATLSSIVGLQRRIVVFVFEETKSSREKVTAPISIQNLAESCKTTSMAAQVTIRRLEKKGVLLRGEYKNGRGGWTRYELPNDLFQELLQQETQNKLRTNLEQSWNKLRSQPRTELRTSPSSSSSILNIYKTTTSEEVVQNQSTKGGFELSPEWQEVDIEALSSIGFSKHHLIQIARQELLTPDLVQDSISAFAFDLKTNGKEKGINSPINFFMGILRKGMPYTPPDNYVSPKDTAIRKILEIRKKEEESAKELKELEFRKWLRETPVEEKKKLVGESYGIKYTEESPLILARLRGHYNEK